MSALDEFRACLTERDALRADLAALQQAIEALCAEADGRPGFSSVWTHQLRAALAAPAAEGER